jgi:hypothetical protein
MSHSPTSFVPRGKTENREETMRIAKIVASVTFLVLTIAITSFAATVFQDGFEPYSAGSFPGSGDWQLIYSGVSAAQQYVDTTHYVAGSKSLHLVGSNCWSADSFHEVEIPTRAKLDVKVFVDHVVTCGCTPILGSVNFSNPTLGTWGTGFGMITFNCDGNIYALQKSDQSSKVLLMSYSEQKWYHIETYVDLSARTFDVYIDGVLRGSGLSISDAGTPTGIKLSAGHGGNPTVWFDEVSVSTFAGGTGKIVVANDDWSLSDSAFAAPNDPGTFATNVASWFTGGRPGKFHAYSDHFGLTGLSLASAMTGAGHSWTSGTTGFTFDLATLQEYDGIFLLVAPADNNVLIDYVESGGNVYLAYSGDGSRLDEQYSAFVNHFGLGLGVINNRVAGNVTINSAHPIFVGVDSLYNGNGSDIVDLAPTDPRQTIVVSQNGHGLYAVYDGGDSFTQADLAGTWFYEVFGDTNSTNAPLWGYGTVTVDGAGTVTGGTARNSLGQTDTLAGGSLTIDSAGLVTGTIRQGNGLIQNLPYGKLNAGKSVLTMVNSTQNSPYRALFVAQKGGGTFAQADLAGTWYFQALEDGLSTNAPYWASGTMIVDSTGNVTGGTAVNDSGTVRTFTGGSLIIDGTGQVIGSLVASGGVTGTLPYGKLDTGKSVLTMLSTSSAYRGMFVMAKGGATFTQADLTGTWYFQVYGDSPSANMPYWGSGTMIVDAAGNVTGGSAVNDSGTVKTLTGGSLAINSTGQVTGTVTLSDGSVESLPHGKLDAEKGILVMVDSDLTLRHLFMAEKGGSDNSYFPTPVLTVTKSGTGSGTITSSPSGINCGSTCTASYDSGTMVTLTATPDTGSSFTGWSAPCSGRGTCTVTLGASTQVTATFVFSLYFDTVQKFYLGYYQRPADAAGLLFWANALAQIDTGHTGVFSRGSILAILGGFAYSAEARSLYQGEITSMNIATVVDSIYFGLFHRHADPGGLAFYVNGFNTKGETPATILWSIMGGAQGTDTLSVQNKATAAMIFTRVIDPELDGQDPLYNYAGDIAAQKARDLLATVTEAVATIPTLAQMTTWMENNLGPVIQPVIQGQ